MPSSFPFLPTGGEAERHTDRSLHILFNLATRPAGTQRKTASRDGRRF